MTHYDEITTERARQDAKFGIQSHKPIEWLTILVEEVGEVSREICENHFPIYGHNDWTNYRTELIQVAAVVKHMLENFDEGII
jgi:NTP pyrophosphatase (non-canonical NTP hydrolase)